MWRTKSKTASRLALKLFHKISFRFADFAFDPENRCGAIKLLGALWLQLLSTLRCSIAGLRPSWHTRHCSTGTTRGRALCGCVAGVFARVAW